MSARPEGIITMRDMEIIFSVTDSLGIHRESVSVELSREDPGSISRSSRGKIEITVPESGTIEEFSQLIRQDLKAMGYTAAGDDAEE
jgi:hypothetical protein